VRTVIIEPADSKCVRLQSLRDPVIPRILLLLYASQ